MPNTLDDATLGAGQKVYARKANTEAFTEAVSVDASGNLLLGGGLSGVKASGSFVALGTTNGRKINGGTIALDGSNPTPVAHGLTTCTGFVAILQGTSAPGDNTSVLTYNINGANVDVYAWKNTGGTDPTLVASTGTETISWIAIGS
jgi:hypothetical protein